MYINIVKTFLIGLFGGWLFTLFHIPLSWLLGSMTAAFLIKKWLSLPLHWPPLFQNIGLIVVGYTIGLSFSKQTVIKIVYQLPSMLFATIAVILFSAFLALAISKLTGINYKSTLAGSIPGGLAQMVALGGELKEIDLTVVTIIQLTRLISVIFLVPFLVFSPWLNKNGFSSVPDAAASPPFEASIAVFLAFASLCAFAAKKGRWPTPYLIGPVIGIGLVVTAGVDVPHLPSAILDTAQIFLGVHLGFILNFENSMQTAKFTAISIAASCLLVLFSFAVGILLMHGNGMTLLTAFISTAPGGMAEMALVGQAVHANLSIIVGYHLFRLLFILFLIPPFLKWLYRQKYFQKKEAS